MLFANQPPVFRLFIPAVLLTFCAILFLNYHIGVFPGLRNVAHEATVPPVPTSALLTSIPKRIWYKLGPKGMSAEAQAWTDTCLQKNPSYRAAFITDLSGDLYVKGNYNLESDIVDTYMSLSIPILKADFLRYLLLFAEGGIWSDLDVSCKDTPIDDWIPAEYKNNASVVVGWEFDVGWGDNFIRQFESWTIMSKPGSPHMQMVIDDIVDGLLEKAKEHNVPISELTLNMTGDVVDITGPRRLTRSIFKSLENTLNTTINGTELYSLLEPKLVGDVLIMPGYSFAASSNNYTGFPGDHGPALVTHHYAGTWKNEHGGEMS